LASPPRLVDKYDFHYTNLVQGGVTVDQKHLDRERLGLVPESPAEFHIPDSMTQLPNDLKKNPVDPADIMIGPGDPLYGPADPK
jgi:hypothetical protein